MNPILNQSVRVTQEFGGNAEMYKVFNLAGHNGIDFATVEGTPIFSPIESNNFYTDYEANGYGKYIQFRNSEFEVTFGHLSYVSKKTGDQIKVGDFLGYTGNTGFSTGPHLHFGIREISGGYVKNYDNGYFGYVDPRKYFPNDSDFVNTSLVDTLANPNSTNTATDYDLVPDWAKDAYDFVIEEGISNGERPTSYISREEFFLMLLRFSEFIGEEWQLDENFSINFQELDVANRPSEWAEDAYTFVVSEDISNGERPREYISRQELWVLLYRFLKDYTQFISVSSDLENGEGVSDWAKDGYNWVVKNNISNGERPSEYISRAEVRTMLFRIFEIFED